jgi:hypothetical protein
VRVSPTLLAAGIAAILLSACSSAPQAGIGGLPQTGVSGSHAGLIDLAPDRGNAAAIVRRLYVTNFSNSYAGSVRIYRYGTWANLGTITNGINGPYGGDWVDRNGHLYVSNTTTNPGSITEYDPSGNLIFTYNAGMYEPVGLTTDRAGNLYEADESLNRVNEYAQRSNVVAATCSLPYGDFAIGVAVNGGGQVFVTFGSNRSGNSGGIMEYPHGLNASCGSVQLPIVFSSLPGGIAIDRQRNLVVCDQLYSSVSIIPPPYTSKSGGFAEWYDPYMVTIDREGTQAYVSDIGKNEVTVLTWPGGSIVATLGSANGLIMPTAAVDSKNYAP